MDRKPRTLDQEGKQDVFGFSVRVETKDCDMRGHRFLGERRAVEGVFEAGALGGEEFGAGVGDDHAVFDADAELGVEVNAGFVGEGHAGFELGVVTAYKVGPLVHVEADAVAYAMEEEVVIGAVAGVGDDLASGCVDGLHFYTGAGRGQGCGLGVADGVEDLALLI